MKHTVAIFTLMLLALSAAAQKYSFTFRIDRCTDTMLYLAEHYRDELHMADSTRPSATGKYIFAGRRTWPDGIYALVRQDGKTVLTDILVQGSRVFTLTGDSTLSAASVTVKGNPTCQLMFDYRAVQEAATREADSMNRLHDSLGLAALESRMRAYEQRMHDEHPTNLYLQLSFLCDPAPVPDSVSDKARHFRTHYWDPLFDSLRRTTDPIQASALHRALLHSPQLFKKMNYFFFGQLYHADADTIMAEVDRLMARIGADTALARYVLQFVEPRYFRSTRNIGWDAVWCHIAEEYILKGRCPWMRESEVYLARQNHKRISQSIIGAHGQELWMLDTTQIDSREHWHSSHRQPTRYVVLWFWDPDCHHCQEQSAELKELYDSMVARNEKRFEVYAVGYDSDIEKWKRYVREHDFRWINVGGTHVNIDYQEAYNVHGAPTMIILNERRDIIMNKVLPIKNLMGFLDEYEKRSERK